MTVRLSQLALQAGVVVKGVDRELPLTVRVDSRETQKGEGFVALRGTKVDGHRFIPDVLAKGGALIVCEAAAYREEWSSLYPQCAFILTPERCEYGLASLASVYLKSLERLRETVAITGSVGKTSAKNDTKALLEGYFKIHAAAGNYNTLIGCAVTVLAAPADTEGVLLEMGANHRGEIAEMTRYLPPTIAAVTEVAPAHLENFGSLEGVLQAKTEIFASENLRCAVINGDNGMLCKRAEELRLPEVIRFGRRGEVLFAREHLSWEKDHFTVRAILTGLDGLSFNLSLPLAGVHQLYPLCCAVAIAGRLGLSSREIAASLPKCRNSAGRGEIRLSESGAAILDECYNASPAAVKASLAAMDSADIPGRRFLILGEMLELGTASVSEHGKIFERALRVSDLLYLFGEEWKNVDGTADYYYDSIDALIEAVDGTRPGEGDVILVKGSRGNHLERVVRALEL